MSGWPFFDDEQLAAAAAVLRSGRVNYWTGAEGRQFESEFAAYAGARHGIALANGTLALELALRSLGIGQGDEVVVTPRSFIASVSAVVQIGARPVFADVDPESQNITPDSVAAVLTPRTRAIVPVHLAGWPCDMEGLMALAQSRDLRVVEDCAQAHGARLRGRPVGSFGDFGAFSFCQDKIMTTAGEGGMLVTDRTDAYERAWTFKDHGKSYRKMQEPQAGSGFRYVHDEFGSNYRLTEIQAAIGRVQLRRLDEWLGCRRRNAGLWRAALENTPGLVMPRVPSDIEHAYYKFYVFVEPGALGAGWDRDAILAALVAGGVPAFTGACPEIYRERAFDAYPAWRPRDPLPVARRLGDRSLMFLVDPSVAEADIVRWAEVVNAVMRKAVRQAPGSR